MIFHEGEKNLVFKGMIVGNEHIWVGFPDIGNECDALMVGLFQVRPLDFINNRLQKNFHHLFVIDEWLGCVNLTYVISEAHPYILHFVIIVFLTFLCRCKQ